MIRVLVVEDSPVIRDYLVYVLESDPALRVVATAADGEQAVASVAECRPDVVLMDIHLPGIDGLETTRRIMSSSPVPIVICTASTHRDQTRMAIRALDAGALAVLPKPEGLDHPNAETDAAALVSTLKAMSEVKVVRRWNRTPPASPAETSLPADRSGRDGAGVRMVAVGASTGGPAVLLEILSALPAEFPAPFLVVQHISAGFTAGLAQWLAAASRLPVRVATHGETPLPGHVYLAPDDHHLRVGRRGELQTTRDEPHQGLRPSAGVLFHSVAERFGPRAIGVLLTGMGRDGAEELKLMADRGALTVVQDRESSVVFGMPAEAIRLGAAQYVFPPQKIAELLVSAARHGSDGRNRWSKP